MQDAAQCLSGLIKVQQRKNKEAKSKQSPKCAEENNRNRLAGTQCDATEDAQKTDTAQSFVIILASFLCERKVLHIAIATPCI